MPHHTTLTPRQKRFLEYLQQEIDANGHAPSLRKAAVDLGISHTAVAAMLQTLQDKKILKRDGRYSRSITLLPPSQPPEPSASSVIQVPIIGRVAAGLPLYAQQVWDGSIAVDRLLYRGTNLFALRIKGDSMKEVGILDGDLAICEPRQYADNGEIVVALVDGEEATVKRFFYRGDHIELVPENSTYPSMRYGLGDVLIQGRVIGIHRGPEQMAEL